jgi:RHS repeat-associated protein
MCTFHPSATPRSSRGFLLAALLVFLAANTARAQVQNLTDATSTPIPAVGHDYIGVLSDTVNPATGSLSLRIGTPTPAGRRMTLPFFFSYDSNGVFVAGPVGQTTGWHGPMGGYLTAGGWSYSLPMLTTQAGFTKNGSVDCGFLTSYIFYDVQGTRHGLLSGHISTSHLTQCPRFTGPAVAVAAGARFSLLYEPLPKLVAAGDGTVYSLGAGIPDGLTNGSDYIPVSIEDSDGNIMTIKDSTPEPGNSHIRAFTVSDDVGRTLISSSGIGSNGDTVSIAGLSSPYTLTWSSQNVNFTTTWTSIHPPTSGNGLCQPATGVTGSFPAVTAITLPNGKQYTFSYDQTYGVLNKITYPSGGYVSYQWGLDTQSGYQQVTNTSGWLCEYVHDRPAILHRFVSFDGQTVALQQDFSYSNQITGPVQGPIAAGTTTVTTHDLVRGTTTKTVYTNSYDSRTGSLLDTSIAYQDGNGNILKTVNKTWLDRYDLSSESVTLDNGLTSKTVYGYDSLLRTQEKDEYDFGQTTPSRKTTYTYQSFAMSPLFPTASPTITPIVSPILNRPCSVVTSDGAGNRVAETDYFYDNAPTTTVCGAAGTPSVSFVSSLVANTHDETNYGSSSTAPRGNLTSLTRRCFPSCSDSVTTAAYDETGQAVSVTDARGNTTQLSHVDSFSDTPPSGNTNAYLTKITRPNTGHAHVETFSYAYSDGQLTASTDENGQQTKYFYNDSLRRLTETDFPDGGQTTLSYNDTAPSPSVTTSRKMNITGQLITSISVMDGLGHVLQTQLTSDPDGATYVDTTYDALGRAHTVSNPHRSSALPTDGTTTYLYDALGRVCVVVPPDGTAVSGSTCPATQPSNDVFTTYAGNTTTVIDQAGKSRKSQIDALGRLTTVWEDPAGLNYQTTYGYDALSNLTSVLQNGSRQRTFAYDSLSRLLCASNPEIQIATCPNPDNGAYTPGTIRYGYDANGSITSKTGPAPNQTGSATVTLSYCYDALNRLTSKAYSLQSCPMSSPVATYSYDQTTSSGLTVTNGIGRRTGMTDSAGSEAWSYDSMGRALSDQRTTNGLTKTYSYTYNLDGSVATTTHPDTLVVTLQQGGAGRPIGESSIDASYAYNVHYAPDGSLCYWKQNWGSLTTANRTFNNRFQPVSIYESSDSAVAPPTPCTTPTVASNLPTDFTYSYADSNGHNNGNVTQIANNFDSHRTQSFTYDSLNRIATASTLGTNTSFNGLADCWGEQFGYDAWGNLLSITGVSSAYTGCTQESLSVAVNAKNQVIGNTYDSAGNLIIDPANTQYTYDAENHLTATAGQTYFYDGDGKRVEKASGSPLTVNKLYWYGTDSAPVLETDAAGNELYRYFRFNGLLVTREEANDWVDHYGLDALGNVRWLYSNSGAWDIIDYYPFGGERLVYSTSAGNNNLKFTGKERDPESGLDNFGARYYSSTLGRFMSADWSSIPVPVPYANLTNPQTLNLYAIVRDNPETFADLDGHTSRGGPAPQDPGGCDNPQSGPSRCTKQEIITAGQTALPPQQSPYQKYMEQENPPATEADIANALKQAGQMGDAGVKAGLAVVGAEAAVAGAVVAAPAVAAAGSQAATAINTATTSAYVQATTALSAAGTAIGNAYRAGVELAQRAVVTIDTLKSGGGAFNRAANFAQGYNAGSPTPRQPPPPNSAGLAGFVVRLVERMIMQ